MRNGTKRRKKYALTLPLALGLSLGSTCGVWAAAPEEAIPVTEEILETMPYPYSVFLEKGEYRLLEYTPQADGSLSYAIWMGEGLDIAYVEQTVQDGDYLLTVTEGDKSDTFTVPIDRAAQVEAERAASEQETLVFLEAQQQEKAAAEAETPQAVLPLGLIAFGIFALVQVFAK